MALTSPSASNSPGQAALVSEAGPPAPNDIRQRVDQDAALNGANDSFIDKLLYWRRPDSANAVVDPQKESQRLREDAALGQSPQTGETPVIQPRKQGWFQSLFSWL
jgi:hypothetical protein